MQDFVLIASAVAAAGLVIVLYRMLVPRRRSPHGATHGDDGWIATMPILHGTHHEHATPAHHHHHDASCGHDAGGADAGGGGGDGGGGGGDGGGGGGSD